MKYSTFQLFTLLIIVLFINKIEGHGFLSFPASRNHLGKAVQSSTPPPYQCAASQAPCKAIDINYNEQGMNGPGFCGDANNVNQHLDGIHGESNNRFSSGNVVARYVAGQKIFVRAFITANHCGFFEVHLVKVPDTQRYNTFTNPDTWTKYKLEIESPDLSHTHCRGINHLAHDPKYHYCIPQSHCNSSNALGLLPTYSLEYKLPAGVTCDRCILHWKYVGAQNPDSSLEVFRNCADVSIVSSSSSLFSNTQPSNWTRSISAGYNINNPNTPVYDPPYENFYPGGRPTTTNYCSGKPDGINCVPTDPKGYVICSGSHIGVIQYCASPLVCNQQTQGCDWTDGTSSSPSTSTTGTSPTTTSNPTPTPSVGPTTTGGIDFCSGKPSQDYCHPSTSSNHYITCPNSNVIRNCPPGLVCANVAAGIECRFP